MPAVSELRGRMCDMRLSHAHRVCERKLRFTAFNTANVPGAVVYGPAIVTAGFAVGYGAGTHVEQVVRTLGPVEYVVLTVAVVAAGTFFLWRAIRA
jgi:membrane protein DedA with SNARE-associated domain